MRRLAGYEAPCVGLRPGRNGNPRDYLGELQELLAAGKHDKAVAHTLAYDAQIMGAQFEVPTEELAQITVPTLVLGGDTGAASMKAAQQKVADAVPAHGAAPSTGQPTRPPRALWRRCSPSFSGS